MCRAVDLSRKQAVVQLPLVGRLQVLVLLTGSRQQKQPQVESWMKSFGLKPIKYKF